MWTNVDYSTISIYNVVDLCSVLFHSEISTAAKKHVAMAVVQASMVHRG